MTLHLTPEQTPEEPNRPSRGKWIELAVLIGTALSLITIANIWPSYGTACALMLATLVTVLQIIRDRR